MDRGIRNWMFVSIAILLVEGGGVAVGTFHWVIAGDALFALAALLILIMVTRYVINIWRK